MSKTLTAADIFGADDLKTKSIPMEEFGWPGSVLIRVFPGTIREEFEQQCVERSDVVTQTADMKGMRSWTLIRACVDEKGELIFKESDVERLEEKNGAALDHLFNEITKLNGLDKDSLDNAAKNSQGDRNESSGTESPENAASQT